MKNVICCLAIFYSYQLSKLSAQEPDRQNLPRFSKPVTVAGLELAIAPARPQFGLDEELAFLIRVTNRAKQPLTLETTTQLGSTLLGKYKYAIRGADTRDWEITRDKSVPLPGAPAEIKRVRLDPGQTFRSRIVLPVVGTVFLEKGKKTETVRRFLPAGKYALRITMNPLKSVLTSAPAPFEVANVPKTQSGELHPR